MQRTTEDNNFVRRSIREPLEYDQAERFQLLTKPR